MSKPIPVDITDELRATGALVGSDYEENDRVYAFEGLKVKVKTVWETVSHRTPLPNTAPDLIGAMDVIRASGSIVGDDGKALRLDNGIPAVYPFGHHLTLQHDTAPNVVVEVERLRFECVEQTARAYATHSAMKGLTGVKRVTGL